MALVGKVVAITGSVFVINPNGSRHQLNLGDQVAQGDIVETIRGAFVDIMFTESYVLHIEAEQQVTITIDITETAQLSQADSAVDSATIQTVIQALESGDDISDALEATAAGSGVPSSDYGFSFVDTSVTNYSSNDIYHAPLTETPPSTFNTYNPIDTTISTPVTGTNAAAVISGDKAASLTETNAVQTATGTLTSTDADGTANLFTALASTAGSNGYGSFTMTTAGVWTYTMNTAHDEFVAGTTYTDSVTVTADDGTTQVITVTIAGTNDAAVISGDKAASLTETNAVQTATGTLSSSDADGTANLFTALASTAGSNGYGKFTMTTAGVWTYTMNTAHDEFVAGTTYTDSVTVTAADGTTQVIKVKIAGSNDAAVTAVDNIIYFGTACNNNILTINDEWLLWNDTDVDSASSSLYISSFSKTLGANATHSNQTIAYSIPLYTASAFTYKVSDGISISNTSLAVGLTRSSNLSETELSGTTLDDILIGGINDDKILGDAGNDVLVGGNGNDNLSADLGNDLLIGGVGNDTLAGGLGSDTYQFSRGDGVDVILENDTSANSDTLKLSTGITYDQLWFSKNGDNLDVSVIGSTDKVSIQNWYLGNKYHVERFQAGDGKVLLDTQVAALVQAMAAFALPASGETVLPANYQTVLAPTLVANWQ